MEQIKKKPCPQSFHALLFFFFSSLGFVAIKKNKSWGGGEVNIDLMA